MGKFYLKLIGCELRGYIWNSLEESTCHHLTHDKALTSLRIGLERHKFVVNVGGIESKNYLWTLDYIYNTQDKKLIKEAENIIENYGISRITIVYLRLKSIINIQLSSFFNFFKFNLKKFLSNKNCK